ncbi:MAG: HIT domain-containing protein [Chloroflexi bacterium]|nr:HIT domain-containing protein [Chloroflexota bacterium]
MAEGCIFCRILRGEVKGEVLYNDGQAFVIRDIRPRAPVHLLIIPVQHFTYLTYLNQATEPMVGHLFTVAEEMAKREGLGANGYRLVMNQGKDSGQEVAHLHLHLLGGKHLGTMG